MDVPKLVLVVIALLLWRRISAIDFFTSSGDLSWWDASGYCQNNNGHLILFDNGDSWSEFEDEMDSTDQCETRYWTGNELDRCKNGGKWSYNGWGTWDGSWEPDECPNSECVTAKCSGMRTRECTEKHVALCGKDLQTTTKSTTVITSDVHTTEQTTSLDATTVDVMDTTEDAHTTTVTSDIRTTTMSTPSNTVTSDSETTSQYTSTDAVTSDNMTSLQSTLTNAVTSQKTPALTSDVSISTQITTGYIVNNSCDYCCANNKSRQLTLEELSNSIQELKVQLSVNVTMLSAHKRKLISVYDSRPVSVAIGGVAIAILATVLGFFIIIDLIRLVRFLCYCL